MISRCPVPPTSPSGSVLVLGLCLTAALSLPEAGGQVATFTTASHAVLTGEPVRARPSTPTPPPVPIGSDQRDRSDRSGAVAVPLLPPLAPDLPGTGPDLGPLPVPLPSIAGERIWSGDAETGDLSQFHDTPWNTVVAEEPRIVDDPARAGEHAIAMTIPAGASTDNYGARSEIVPGIPNFQPGEEYDFGFSTYLSDDFPVDEAWQVIAQWKSEKDGSPPMELDVEDGQFLLCGGEDDVFCEPLGEAVTGEWVDWVFRVRLSSDPTEGRVDVMRGDELLLSGFQPPDGTMYDGAESYMKLGYYRKSGIADEGTVYVDEVRIHEVTR